VEEKIRWVVKRKDNGNYLSKDDGYTGNLKKATKYRNKTYAEKAIKAGRDMFDLKAGDELPIKVVQYQDGDWEECE
jgi:hypothetical protein